MNKLPLLIRQYLSRLWLEEGKFAYLSFDKQGNIQSWHPEIKYYGIDNLVLNENITDKLLFLAGWFSCEHDHNPFVLDFVNFEYGVVADVHILPSINETYVLFINVTEKFQQHQRIQQERHNIELLHQQQVKNSQLLKQNYQELEAQKKQIEQGNQAKTKLLSYITHDLRTPLSAILGFTQFLETGVFGHLNKKQHDCVNNMLKAGSYMTGLINEILEVARLEHGNIELSTESLAINALIEDSFSVLTVMADKNDIKLFNHIQSPVKIQVDRKRFQQIITHLISNAIKYNREKGCIILSYRILDEKLRLCIKDTGIGMTDDKIDDIFQPFVRVLDEKDQIEGNEISLSVCKRLVGLMSGSLSVRSELEVGSVFYLDLPLSLSCYGRGEYVRPQQLVYFYEDKIHFNVLNDLLCTYRDYQLRGYHFSEDIRSFNLEHSSTLILLDVDKSDVFFKLQQIEFLEQKGKSQTLAVFDPQTPASNIRYVLEKTQIDHYLMRPFDFNQLLDILECSYE